MWVLDSLERGLCVDFLLVARQLRVGRLVAFHALWREAVELGAGDASVARA